MTVLFFGYLKNLQFKPSYVLKSYFLDHLRIPVIFLIFEMPFYAVAVGKVPGIYKTWEECQNQTKGYPQAKFRKFITEAEATNFVKAVTSQNSSVSSNAVSTYSLPTMIENVNPPVIKRVSNCSSRALLKQDKLSMIVEKLDNFIEQTNKKLMELNNRLDVIESSFHFSGTSDGKRKSDIPVAVQERNKSKKKKLSTSVELSEDDKKPNNDTTLIQSKSKPQSEILEEVDSPWDINKPSLQGFIVDPYGYVIVYTDGACTNNGKQGAKAGVGVWFNHSNPFNVAAPVVGNATNNNAEIQAATRAIQQASLAGIKRLNIHTDSQFMINCITSWIKKWKKNNWLTANGGPVKNKEQLVILDTAIKSMEDVKWTHVRGHVGIEGNHCADSLARSGAELY